ncbi:hypothetical protein DBR40_03955 [Pedobacter sp. KBW01]|uniref:hypothetical protein n=1 Tax=Pedobacter sp. KBW01 TaxID=2153364 RepID=UPI000F5A902F|nr:hypothetical protein [Pedobacter sp. KBW01]RQO78888.1 hypothetical protein DBR40_03955 [Pedobacter sp. KBW01]
MYKLLQHPTTSFRSKFHFELFTLTALLLSLFFFAGCRDSRDGMADFIKAYNEQARYTNTASVSSTSAEADYKEKIIKIKVVTTYSASDPESNFIKQAMPGMMMELLRQQPSSNKLIKDGVKFEITYYTEKLSEILSATLDKKKMEELSKATPDALNNDPSFINPKAKAPSSPIEQILAALNKSLPYTDASNGATIFRIDQNRLGDLVYHVRTPKDLAGPLKTKAGVELMKSEILRSGKLKKLMSGFRKFQINAVKYVYYDQKGNQINELRLTTADLN